MGDDSSSLSQLTKWLQSVGIWWDQSLVQIRGGCSNCSGPALGVFAVSDVQENQLLCIIPRSAILSPRTTQLAQILEAEKLGGGLALTIAVMYEASLGNASTWAGYFASLPAREYLPMFWSPGELALLAGTALEGLAEDDRRDTEEDYEAHVLPLMEKHKQAFPHPELCSLQHFRTAASWVASRSFHVDAWHGDAMVPLADIFNHKASLVLLEDGWQVAEEIDRQQQQQQDVDDEAAADALDDEDDADGEQRHGDSHDDNDDARDDGSNDDSDDESDDEDDDEDDPQHGFAVGGMPMIAAAAAAGAGGAAGPAAAPGIVHKAAGCWVRDGVNLRLEIGICSVGDPDTTLASMTGGAAAAAASEAHIHHEHHAHCGCSAHDEGAASNSTEAAQQKRHAASSDQTQQQRKKQKTQQQQQNEAAVQKEAHNQQQQQQVFPEKRLEIVAASAVAAGAEVHNTYGELSNQALVHKYGFCLPSNPFDELDLGPGWPWLLGEVAAAAGLGKKLKQHVAWLERNSHLLPPAGDADADEDAESAGDATAEPPAVLPGGRLPSVVAAAVRLLGASAAQLKAWGSLQGVLQDDEQQQQEREKSIQMTANPEDDSADVADVADAAAAAAEQAFAEHFDDVQITSHSVEWWGAAGLQLLRAAVQQRIQRYPAHTLSIAADEAALQALQSKQQQQQQHEEEEEASDKQQKQKGGVGSSAGEHAAAVAAALQLRICEQRILQAALDAIEQVLG